MPKSKIILAVGVWIALLPFLGFPQAWRSFFEFTGGFSIVLLSVLISIDRRLSLKARVEKRQARKKALADTPLASDSTFGRRATDKVEQNRFGRRATDPHIPTTDTHSIPTDAQEPLNS